MESTLTIGPARGDHVAIRVLQRAYPSSSDYWDGNWVRSTIHVRAGGFLADVRADLRTDEIHRLADGLRFIDDNLFGSAVLQSMEDWVDLTITCEANGSLSVAGEVTDQPGTGNRLAFSLPGLDQTYLQDWLVQAAAIEAAFPVVGRP
ncbi:hypothetical protein ACFP3Q_03945 [Nocardioides sp. GCM10027113]|uniref:WapI family immunity protein n=1 Tax=unclassified Nocardioides TaxID=2615069 RepID=UPI00361EB139